VIKDDQPVCFSWLWYLSHDMLFFITLPIQVYLYLKRRSIGYAIAIYILVANLGIVLGLTIDYKFSISGFNTPEYSTKIYFKPWCRIGAYQVGVLMGMLYYEYVKGNIQDGNKSTLGYRLYKSVEINKLFRYICYLLGFLLIVSVVFISTPETRMFLTGKRYYGQLFADIFNPLSRPAYVLGLGLILAGPLTGKGSFLQTFLGSRFWAPWAKLSFYAYMIHLFVFTYFFLQERQSFYMGHKSIFLICFAVILVT